MRRAAEIDGSRIGRAISLDSCDLRPQYMKITNLADLSENEFAAIERELAEHKSLARVLAWANTKPKTDLLPRIVSEVIAQDEYTHDVVVPYKDLFLVYDTT
jgi:hypothetical protein